MRSLGYVIACGALMVGTSAHAVSMDITGNLSGWISYGGDVNPYANRTIADYGPNGDLPGSGGSTETKVNITTLSTSFESGVAVSGPGASAQSNSGLNVKIINTGEEAISLNSVGSTIIPAGLGFYMQDRSVDPKGGNIFTGYGQADGSSFASLFSEDLIGQPFATAGFTFDIYGDDFGEGAIPLYSLAGELTLSFNANGDVIRGGGISFGGEGYLPGFENGDEFLDGFGPEFDNPFALAYNWGQTDIDVILNKIMAGGEVTNLYYRTSAYASTQTTCLADSVTCLVAYSGFGDPIGRGGGVSRMASRAVDRIDYLKFDPQLIDPFRPSVSDIGGGGVPEPATWAMMTMGFGLLGAALRRRRVLSYS